MENAECADAVLSVKKLMVLMNYALTVFVTVGIREAYETNPNCVNYMMMNGRAKMNQLHIEKLGNFAKI